MKITQIISKRKSSINDAVQDKSLVFIHKEHHMADRYNNRRQYFNELARTSKEYLFQPPKNLTLPKLTKEQKLPIVLSFDEIRDILTKTKDLREKTILAMLYSCGLRQSELRNLRIEDIDFARNLVYIKQAKGKKTRCIELGKKKNYIFTLEYTDLPMGKDAIRGLVNRCAELAGITKHLTPHIFRHTYATHLLEMGVSIYRLKELLGHSNIINTMVYLHIIKPAEGLSFSPIDRLFPVK